MSLSIYAARPSVFHALHPLTKLTLALCLPISGLLWPWAWASWVLLLGGIAPLAAWGQVAGRLARALWAIVWPFAFSILLIQGFFWRGGLVWLTLGPLQLKAEGIRFALSSIGGIGLVVGSFLLLALTTRPDHLMLALTNLGLPSSVAYVVSSSIQIAPRFQARATAILDAQQARGLETEGNLWRRARAFIPLVLPLVLSSIVEVEERAIALEARGFGAQRAKSSLITLTDSTIQRLWRWGLCLLTLLALGAKVWR
jgi:energy-coupling factor transport system permease protein